jgi:hypothetical protein
MLWSRLLYQAAVATVRVGQEAKSVLSAALKNVINDAAGEWIAKNATSLLKAISISAVSDEVAAQVQIKDLYFLDNTTNVLSLVNTAMTDEFKKAPAIPT